ncbi:MAG: hypothetical protein P9X24_00310 [Candidatus Hatepunaea meridiana]|nr:hypothetical protein [Candidatus Hatepunaea meridiana]
MGSGKFRISHSTTLNEPSIEIIRIGSVVKWRSPEIIITFRFKYGHDLFSGFIQAADLDQHIDNRFGGKSRYGGAPEVFDPDD